MLKIQTIKKGKENLFNQVVMEVNKLKNQKFQDLLATLDNKKLQTLFKKKKLKMKIEMMMVLEIIMKEKIKAIVHTTIVMTVRIAEIEEIEEIVEIEGIVETIEIEENFKKRRIILLILIQISESSILMTRNFTKLLLDKSRHHTSSKSIYS
tara:strand:+ start:188 stop:643 length:456 start_codon:yes stop_codon:yes gene_type:complete